MASNGFAQHILCKNRGIIYVFFHALTFARSQESCLTTRPMDRVSKHLPRDQPSFDAMKQTCEIVIPAYFTLLPNRLYTE